MKTARLEKEEIVYSKGQAGHNREHPHQEIVFRGDLFVSVIHPLGEMLKEFNLEPLCGERKARTKAEIRENRTFNDQRLLFGASLSTLGRRQCKNVRDLISEALRKMGAIVCCVSQEPLPTKEETEEEVKQDYREIVPQSLLTRSVSSVTTLPIH